MLELILLGFFVIATGLMGFSAITRNYKDHTNIVFGGLILTVQFWAVLNYMSNNGSHMSKLVGNRGSFTAGLCVTIMLWFFSQYFPKKRKIPRWQKYILWLSPIFVLTSVTPLLVKSFQDQPSRGVTSIQAGVAYLPTIIFFVAVFVLSAMNLRAASRKYKGELKERVDLVYFGLGAAFVWTLSCSAAIPYFTNNWTPARYGIYGLMFLIGSIFYSMTKHKLFDIRGAVIRSMAFITVQILLVAAYVGAITIVSVAFLKNSFTLREALLISLIAFFISVTLPFILRYFKKLTNRIFFSDSYETQAVINKLTRELVGSVNLEDLSKVSLTTINQAIRARSALLLTKKQTNSPTLVQVGIGVKYQVSDELIELMKKYEKEVYIADDGSGIEEISDHMLKENISLIARMKSHDLMIGYLCFTEKLSGAIYSEQDIRLVTIASSEIALALQNAQRYREIELFNVTLTSKIENATRELRKTNEKLKALDEAKDEFISMASHQLRTPLTSVKGYVSMVLEGDAGKVSGQQRQLLEQAFISSQRMVYLIADLLNVSRLRTGKFVIEAAPTYLPDVVEGEMQQLKESAKAHNLELTFQKPASFPTLKLDETKTRQVIMNFMDNAIYYTPAGGHISVHLEQTDKTVEFKVIDDGLGVPRAEQHHLFTKFFRAGNAKKARPDGTGLGLFMAKKVVVAQSGAIIFVSQEGKGSTFGFSFPRAALEVLPAATKQG